MKAPLETTFAALSNNWGRRSDEATEHPMPMKMERGRAGGGIAIWADENGHLWGHVQAIKRPTLLEIYGPLFMSYPVMSNVQYRLSEEAGGDADQVSSLGAGADRGRSPAGSGNGLGAIHEKMRKRAERTRGGQKSGACSSERAAGEVRHVSSVYGDGGARSRGRFQRADSQRWPGGWGVFDGSRTLHLE